MNSRTFIIVFMLCGKVGFSQLGGSSIDSLNSKMLHQHYPVNLPELGSAHMELKDGTILLKCVILEVKDHWIIYKKRGVLHDQAIDKIKVIRFDEQPYKLEFNELNKGKLIVVYPY